MPKPFICLTFDVEEFDMPLEYGQQITMQQQMKIGYDGLNTILPILHHPKIEATLFTTANFAQHYPKEIEALAKKHEIASHTFYHSEFKNDDLLASRLVLEEISQKPVVGLRMPRMKQVDINEIKKASYLYDSSINPTYIPGRYNNSYLPKVIYNEDGLLRIPTSVTPTLRIPLFWLAFKNFPWWTIKCQIDTCIKAYGYVHLYFHPWEFTTLIAPYKIPFYSKTGNNGSLYGKLMHLIHFYQTKVDFIGLQQLLQFKNHL